MKKRVEDLSVDELDYMVARAEGIVFMRDTEGKVLEIGTDRRIYCSAGDSRMYAYQPSSDWRQGGPIIAAHGISLQKIGSRWVADINREGSSASDSLLIAAMSAFVVTRYGYEVEID